MKKSNLILFSIICILFILHLANALYIGSKIPNCIKSYEEGMTAQFLDLDKPVNRASVYAPLYETISYYTAKLTGKKWNLMCILNNTPFFILMLVFLYLLGKEIADAETGLLSALIISLYPLINASYYHYSMEFPHLALIVMFIYFLHKSEYFINPWYATAAAITALTGLFIKDTFAAFIAGPFLYLAVLAAADMFKVKFKRAITFCIVILSIAVPLYMYFGPSFIQNLHDRTQCESTQNAWYSFDNLRLFWIGLWENQISIPFVILLIPGIYFFLKKETDRNIKFTIFLVLIPANLIVMLMPHWKSVRYLLPQQSLLALISAFAVRNIYSTFKGKLICICIIVIGLIQMYDLTYDKIGFLHFQKFNFKYWKSYAYPSLPEMLSNTKLTVNASQEILKDIEKSKNQRKTYLITFLPQDYSLDYYAMRSYFLLNSDKHMNEMQKNIIIKSINENGNFIIPDYILYIAKTNFKHASIYNKSVNSLFNPDKASKNNDRKPKQLTGWDKIEKVWLANMKSFQPYGLIFSDGHRDAYLYKNIDYDN